ncbi:7-cyano-7-deazaguanine synthase QueC [Shouchella lehensis]|uniref:7-cyano-7-deazaguanine synthase n=1 Tax=Shouchella lehensis TaxID=300825 RepID=A0A4Y7WQ06_9BACI|nr:7-cyano-7-deazaguanine synthase QueC [Shouchella lehensis]MBG9784429.1 7-cyano-7-deazaguanine synthase [Shouchella lehensis]RQW20557.1 7-cyano-7-deazaguanine synthase QueC [Bacillus sp. C1-1]TES50570.1 7-cyano-7-deazaguanine synthase QueC [Shouchella lehensis]
MKKEKAIVVFSGGQDSTTCLFWALEQFTDVSVLIFDYGQRHKNEIKVAKSIAVEAGVRAKVIDLQVLSQLNANALTNPTIAIEEGQEGELPNTFVPGRNHLFLSFAAVVAKDLGAKHIITGVCETDFSGYPDCRDVFVKSLNVTLNLAMNEQFVIHTPLMWLNKEETWAMADQLGKLRFIREKTLTCYEGVIGDGCGRCPACKLRMNGLQAYLQKGEASV